MTGKRDWVSAAVFFVAALTFWLPTIVVHSVQGPEFGGLGVLIMTVACPGIAVIVFVALCLLNWRGSLMWRASFFLLGIWVLGFPCMMVGATFSGGGLHTWFDLGGFVFTWAFFVISTPMMATYDGSLFALLIITCVYAILLIETLATER